jgi:hypothetical protein
MRATGGSRVVNKIIFRIDLPAKALPVLLAPLLFVLTAASGRADMLSFSYIDTSNNVLAGTMDGILQSDNNSFLVTGMGAVTLNGNPTPALNFVDSVDDILGNGAGLFGNAAPAVTLDGTYLDLAACPDSNCTDGFIISAGDATAIMNTAPFFASGSSFGGPAIQSFGQWSAALVVATPEPASFALIGFGLTALAASRRFLVRR